VGKLGTEVEKTPQTIRNKVGDPLDLWGVTQNKGREVLERRWKLGHWEKEEGRRNFALVVGEEGRQSLVPAQKEKRKMKLRGLRPERKREG